MSMPDDEEYADDSVDESDDLYSEEGREAAVEDGEISGAEEGFLEGASGSGQKAKCRKCRKALQDDFIERRGDDDEILRFCSDECCEKYFDKNKK